VTDFELLRTQGPAAALHERQLPDPALAQIWWHDVTTPALVLGSAQDASVVDLRACQDAGVDVIRRRSGGGAVLLLPGEVAWFDVIVPSAHPAWRSDVRASMVWLGTHLRAVLGAGTVHDGGLVSTEWSSVICFDGVGPGEVLVDGAKLIGVSQRRTRAASRFQVCWHTAYDPAALPALLLEEYRPPLDGLRPVATLDPATSAALPELLSAALATAR
jgi:lipoate---protein ligase